MNFVEMVDRLDTSFNTILVERRYKNRLHRTPNSIAPTAGYNAENGTTASSTGMPSNANKLLNKCYQHK